LTDTDGVGVWPNVSSIGCGINQGQGQGHSFTHSFIAFINEKLTNTTYK